jgi:hypothetical protein
MDGVCSGDDVWKTALMSHVVMLVDRFVVPIGEDC